MTPSCPDGPRSWALVLLGLVLATACGDAEPVVFMPIERILVDIPAEPDRRVVETENPKSPVEATTIHPSPFRQFDAGAIAGLSMVPPARVRLNLEGLPRDSELRFGTGYDQLAYELESEGTVRFRIYNGETLLHENFMPFGPGIPDARKIWRRAAVPLGGMQNVVLETHLIRGDPDLLPPAGFGGLKIASDEERPRELATDDHPNLVVVVIDTLRPDRTSTYGYDQETSPHLSALAERGTKFESAWAPSPWTWPSTASLLTTLEPPEHGLMGPTNAVYLTQSLYTLPECLQTEGWTTGAFSTNPLIQVGKGFDQGFESFTEYRWKPSYLLMDEADAWLEQNSEWRFFLYLHLTDPHEYTPRRATSKSLIGTKPDGYSLARLQTAHTRMLRGKSHDIDQLRTDVAYRSTKYDATVFESDEALGRLHDKLAALGRLEDTIIVVTSDHGEAFMEHDVLHHSSTLYDEMVKVPLIIAGPGVPSGRTISERVQNRHLASTLLQLIDVEPTSNLTSGIDLFDDARRSSASAEPFFFTTMLGYWAAEGEQAELRQQPLHGVRVNDELFFHTPGLDRPMRRYFKLDADPTAHEDLSEQFPERCDDLAGMIQVWMETLVARSPVVVGGGRSTQDLLQGIGYVGDDDE